MNAETKQCVKCKQKFIIEPDDFAFYERIGVLPPNLCPDCRMKRKLVWRNERTLYKRTCDLCGKSVVTMYHPRYPAPVYCVSCYHSDKWDPYSYGVAYDSNRPFFEQFGKLLLRVPKVALNIGTADGRSVSSEYINFAGGNKNCYLIFNSTRNENCSYSRGLIDSRDTLDTYFADQLERCYEGANVNKSNGTVYGQNVLDAIDSIFLLNCAGVQNCFGCVNLRHKSYHFFNEPLKKEEWERRISEIRGSYQRMEEAKRKFEKFWLKFPRRENTNLKAVNSSGEYIFESKNCHSCFEAFACEDCKYAFSIKLTKDSYDLVGRGIKSELLLETVASGHGCSRVLGSWFIESSRNIEYSHDVRSSEECIGCAGLKHAKYYILNKQYSEEEYKKLRDQIVGELKKVGAYGLYFPPELSPWAYNETLAEENYPLGKEKAIAEGFRWEEDIPRTRGKETMKPEEIPDNIKDVEDSIVDEVLVCTGCGYNYRLIPSEFEFYKRMVLPVPRKCFDCRHRDRLRRRGPFKLYARTCAKCDKQIQTIYAPDRPEIVYCEQCYQSEVV